MERWCEPPSFFSGVFAVPSAIGKPARLTTASHSAKRCASLRSSPSRSRSASKLTNLYRSLRAPRPNSSADRALGTFLASTKISSAPFTEHKRAATCQRPSCPHLPVKHQALPTSSASARTKFFPTKPVAPDTATLIPLTRPSITTANRRVCRVRSPPIGDAVPENAIEPLILTEVVSLFADLLPLQPPSEQSVISATTKVCGP